MTATKSKSATTAQPAAPKTPKPAAHKKVFDREQAVKDYATGNYTFAEVGAKYGVSGALIRIQVRKTNPSALKVVGGFAPTYNYKAAAKDYATGKYGMRGLGEKYGVTAAAISKMLKREFPEILEKVKARREAELIAARAKSEKAKLKAQADAAKVQAKAAAAKAKEDAAQAKAASKKVAA